MPGSATHQKGEPLPQVIEKSDAYLKWKAESMRANFKVRCNTDIEFELAEGVLYAVGSDFESSRDMNKALSDILPAQPTVGVFGDCTGAVSISCLAHLTAKRLVQVAYQDAKSQAVLNDNVAAFVAPTETELNVGGSGSQTYAQYMSDRALWETGKYASHSSHPWEYFKNLAAYWSKNTSSASHKHFDLLVYEEIWNKAFQIKLREIQKDMALPDKTPEKNYNRPRDSDLVNDLKFYDHETSPLEAMQFMDEFILEPLFAAGGTCDVLVCKTRAMITDADWETLKKGGSKLALNYTMTFEMEEVPNARSNRMNYNSHTGTTDLQYDDHKHKFVDVNGGVHSKFYTYIFQKNADGLQLKSFCYKRPPWYGAFFCCCDAKKQAIYVKTDTCHKPFTRISHDRQLKVIFGRDYLALDPEEQRVYFKVDPLRRKIDVQIEDLTFLAQIFGEYIDNYTRGSVIAESTTRDIKRYLAQAWYTYRVNDCILSQSCAGDTPLKKQEGEDRIKRKIDLFLRVKEDLIPQIMQHNNWTAPLDLHLPWHPHDPYNPANLHEERGLHALLSQFHGLSANWTLGDADEDYDTGNKKDGSHREDYEKAFRNGTATDDAWDFYRKNWGEWDGEIHSKNHNGKYSNQDGRSAEGRQFYLTGGKNGHNAGAGAEGRGGNSVAQAEKNRNFQKRQRENNAQNNDNERDDPNPGKSQKYEDDAERAARKHQNFESKNAKRNKQY